MKQVATFRELYRSRDGRITVFEDAQGHLTSVDSRRLVQPVSASEEPDPDPAPSWRDERADR